MIGRLSVAPIGKGRDSPAIILSTDAEGSAAVDQNSAVGFLTVS